MLCQVEELPEDDEFSSFLCMRLTHNTTHFQCKGEDEAEEVVMNGVHDLQLDHDMDQPSSSSKILSSSMEKEFS